MYPPEASFTVEELEIIFRIRQLIGDEKETFIDDVSDVSVCADVSASGSIYGLQEPKGYPQSIYVDGVEYISTSGTEGVEVLGYKYLRFTNTSPTLVAGTSLVVIYEHFSHSDLEILNTYDTSATTYLVAQCNLSVEDLGLDLLVLATAYVLLSKDLSVYIKSAVEMEDSDSKFVGSRRPQSLQSLLNGKNGIAECLKAALEKKTSCKMLSLPIYKVE
jgi:hypothetical protein